MVVGYCVILTITSFCFGRFVKDTDDFFGSSRTTPWWTAGLSFFMTAFSAAVFIGGASFTYRYGGLSLLNVLWCPFLVTGYFIFSKRWHRTGCKTVIEFIVQRFSNGTANFFLITGIPFRLLDNANRVYVTSVVLEVMMGIDLLTAAIITTIIAILFTIVGGYLSVIATDALQAIILAAITILISIAALIKAGGPVELFNNLPDGYFSLKPADGQYDYWFIISLGIVSIFSWNGYWSLVQRYVSVPTERDAQKVALTGGISYISLFPIFALPAIAAVVLIPGLQGAVETEQAYLRVAQMVLPTGLLAIMFLALLGATITALNSEYNVISQILLEDVVRKHMPNFVEKHGLNLGRVLVVVIAILCMIISLYVRKMGGAFHFLATLMGMTTIPTFLPLLYGLLFNRTPGWGACAAFLGGVTVSCIMQFGYGCSLPMIVLGNGTTTLLIMVLTGHFAPKAVPFTPVKRDNDTDNKARSSASITLNRPMFNILGGSLLVLAAFCLLSLFDSNGNAALVWAVTGMLSTVAIILLILGNFTQIKSKLS